MSLLESVSNQYVRIMSNNMEVISYIKAMEECRDTECNAVAKEIWSCAFKRHIWLSLAHQPGRLNVTADWLGWKLNRGLFEKKNVGFLVLPDSPSCK